MCLTDETRERVQALKRALGNFKTETGHEHHCQPDEQDAARISPENHDERSGGSSRTLVDGRVGAGTAGDSCGDLRAGDDVLGQHAETDDVLRVIEVRALLAKKATAAERERVRAMKLERLRRYTSLSLSCQCTFLPVSSIILDAQIFLSARFRHCIQLVWSGSEFKSGNPRSKDQKGSRLRFVVFLFLCETAHFPALWCTSVNKE